MAYEGVLIHTTNIYMHAYHAQELERRFEAYFGSLWTHAELLNRLRNLLSQLAHDNFGFNFRERVGPLVFCIEHCCVSMGATAAKAVPNS
ncbi:unnamed protein product [Sphenostylis stenocarpa]|uniref:Uncharacterized protein n=1 Tax=Sphenostylis stenocarpa TaxID=92480 RepID=A0AA86V7P6_9FABA|nr:unnamed protein product [Sphenostylis stenocarpa]